MGNLNIVTQVEIVVILAIVIFTAYVFYSLDLFKKG
jgi:hypothetical protein